MEDLITSFTAELSHPVYDGTESGYGYGHGCGYGDGYGHGDGDGCCGHGYSNGNLRYVKTYCGKPVYDIDRIPTVIYSVRHGVAFGAMLRDDLTTTPCVIVKSGHTYAHGASLREAMAALQAKLCDGMTEEERIEAFWEYHNRTDKYSGWDLYHWHHVLTGSCEFGRNEFAKSHGIDVDNSEFTVAEFVELCKNSYGGEIIRKLAE